MRRTKRPRLEPRLRHRRSVKTGGATLKSTRTPAASEDRDHGLAVQDDAGLGRRSRRRASQPGPDRAGPAWPASPARVLKCVFFGDTKEAGRQRAAEGGQSDGPESGKENEQVDGDSAQRGRRGALQYLCLFLRADEQHPPTPASRTLWWRQPEPPGLPNGLNSSFSRRYRTACKPIAEANGKFAVQCQVLSKAMMSAS